MDRCRRSCQAFPGTGARKGCRASLDPHAACADVEEEMQDARYVIAAVEGEELAVVEEAVVTAREVAKCEKLRAWAVAMKMRFSSREAVRRKSSLLKRNNPKTTEYH